MKELSRKDKFLKIMKNKWVISLIFFTALTMVISIISFALLMKFPNDNPRLGYISTFALSWTSVLLAILLAIFPIIGEKISITFYTKVMFSDLFNKAYSIEGTQISVYNFQKKLSLEEFANYAKERTSNSSHSKKYYDDILHLKNERDIEDFFKKNENHLSEVEFLKLNNISLEHFLLVNEKIRIRNSIWHHARKENENRKLQENYLADRYSYYRTYFNNNQMLSSGIVVDNIPGYLALSENNLFHEMNKNVNYLVENILNQFIEKNFKLEDYTSIKKGNYSLSNQRMKFLAIDSYFTYNQNKLNIFEAIDLQKRVDELYIPDNKQFWILGKVMSDIERFLDFFGTLKQDMVRVNSLPNDFISCNGIFNLNMTILKHKKVFEETWKKISLEIEELKDSEIKRIMHIWLRALTLNFEITYLQIDKLYTKQNFLNSVLITIAKARNDIKSEYVRDKNKIFFSVDQKFRSSYNKVYTENSDIFTYSWNDINDVDKLRDFIQNELVNHLNRVDLSNLKDFKFSKIENQRFIEVSISRSRVLEIYVNFILYSNTSIEVLNYIKEKEKKAE